jgi:DNA-binding transcriptional LysR family regulator
MDDALQDLRVADLVTFLAVHHARSVSAAARVLGVTPSQVSKAVARLEHALNVELLVRSPRGVAISDVGRGFVSKIEELVTRLDGLRSEETVSRPELTVAAPSYLHRAFVPAIAESLADHRLRCLSMPQMLVRAYASERLFHAAVTAGRERFPERWVETELGPLRSALFVAPSLAKRLGKGPIKQEDLAEIPFISPIYVVNGQAVPVEDRCPLGRGRRRLGTEVETIGVALDLAALGNQVVFGPAIAAHDHVKMGRLVELAVTEWKDNPVETIYLYCDGDQMLARVQRSLVERCAATLRD